MVGGNNHYFDAVGFNMIRGMILALMTVTMLGGCVERSKRVLFDGKHYPTRERAVSKEDRNSFTVSVRRASQGIDGAREAGRHGGSKYCIKNFGTSEIDWAVGPDDAAASLVQSNGNLVLSGRCITW